MLSKSFAVAMNVHTTDMEQGNGFVTAGGAVEIPMGVTRTMAEFVLSRGTPREHRVLLLVIIVDTTVFDALSWNLWLLWGDAMTYTPKGSDTSQQA